MAELTRKELVLILAGVPQLACRKPDHLVRLAGVDLSGLDLRGLNLSHVDLTGANLRNCNLSDARLYESELSGADLTDATMRGVYGECACFIDAIAVRADFRRSDRDLYYGTHLMGADFEGADLTDANLEGANLWGARFTGARLARTDLRRARMNGQTLLAGAFVDETLLGEVDWAEVTGAEGPREDRFVLPSVLRRRVAVTTPRAA